MSAAPVSAMVLAAGLGTRMRPLTNDRPKPLIEVAGRALVDHMLDRLAEAGVRQAVVNVHYLADRLEAHLAARVGAPEIIVSDERSLLLETGGALVKARPVLGESPIFVANTDQVWLERGGPALPMLARAWDETEMDALLLLAAHAESTGYAGAGDFILEPDGRLRRRGNAPVAPFVYTGVQILRPALLDGFEAKPFSLNEAWDKALAARRLFGVVLDGLWMHVGDPEGLAEAERRLAPR